MTRPLYTDPVRAQQDLEYAEALAADQAKDRLAGAVRDRARGCSSSLLENLPTVFFVRRRHLGNQQRCWFLCDMAGRPA